MRTFGAPAPQQAPRSVGQGVMVSIHHGFIQPWLESAAATHRW